MVLRRFIIILQLLSCEHHLGGRVAHSCSLLTRIQASVLVPWDLAPGYKLIVVRSALTPAVVSKSLFSEIQRITGQVLLPASSLMLPWIFPLLKPGCQLFYRSHELSQFLQYVPDWLPELEKFLRFWTEQVSFYFLLLS